MNLIKRYYRHSVNYSRTRFILELAFASLILKIILGFIIVIIAVSVFNKPHVTFGSDSDFHYRNYEYSLLITSVGIIIPFFETFTQWLSIAIMKKITRNYLVIILFTAFLFASLHISYSILYAIIMIPSGLALSWSFYCKLKKSLAEAFFITFAIHSIHNMLSILSIMMS